MANAKLAQAAKDAGVNNGDVAVLERVGLTEGVLTQAEAKGWTLKDIWEMYQQFGPSIIAFFTALFSRSKAEADKPQPASGEKKPDKEKHPIKSGREPSPGEGDGDMR